MDSTPSNLDFAAIGHQESWKNITSFVNSIRSDGQERLSCEKIKNIFRFISPKELFRITARSKTGLEINGVYIETFIEPDKLSAQFVRSNITKVLGAMDRAKKMGSKMVTLGGFTSIVLEGNLESFSTRQTKFTTGNTLTAAFIVKGIEKAAKHLEIDLQQSDILIIGATGDIGMACVDYMKRRVNKLLLCARNYQRLEKMAGQLIKENVKTTYSVHLEELLPKANIIVSVASSIGIKLDHYKKGVLICDAGYPKNLENDLVKDDDVHLFHGGMGQVTYGYDFYPDYSKTIYHYDAPFIAHGCVLEAMVLAFEKRFQNFSIARGNIATEKMEEIYSLSVKHGIELAPFYNGKGLW